MQFTKSLILTLALLFAFAGTDSSSLPASCTEVLSPRVQKIIALRKNQVPAALAANRAAQPIEARFDGGKDGPRDVKWFDFLNPRNGGEVKAAQSQKEIAGHLTDETAGLACIRLKQIRVLLQSLTGVVGTEDLQSDAVQRLDFAKAAIRKI